MSSLRSARYLARLITYSALPGLSRVLPLSPLLSAPLQSVVNTWEKISLPRKESVTLPASEAEDEEPSGDDSSGDVINKVGTYRPSLSNGASTGSLQRGRKLND